MNAEVCQVVYCIILKCFWSERRNLHIFDCDKSCPNVYFGGSYPVVL